MKKAFRLGALALAVTTALMSPVFAAELKLVWYVDGDEQEAKLRGMLDQYTAANP